MSISGATYSFMLASDIGQLFLLVVLFARKLDRAFTAFTAFILWQVLSDILVYLALGPLHEYVGKFYGDLYYTLRVLAYVFEVLALLEIAANVLHPTRRSSALLRRYVLYGVIFVIGVALFSFSVWVSPVLLPQAHAILVIDRIAAALCVVLFLFIAGFSQVLGLNWRSHVLQLSTGFAFYSVLDLLVQLMQGQLHRGPSYGEHYQMWSWVGALSYLCTLYFWCWAFAKKEAPRRDFSPQMAKFLASLSRGAKKQRAALARSCDEVGHD